MIIYGSNFLRGNGNQQGASRSIMTQLFFCSRVGFGDERGLTPSEEEGSMLHCRSLWIKMEQYHLQVCWLLLAQANNNRTSTSEANFWFYYLSKKLVFICAKL